MEKEKEDSIPAQSNKVAMAFVGFTSMIGSAILGGIASAGVMKISGHDKSISELSTQIWRGKFGNVMKIGTGLAAAGYAAFMYKITENAENFQAYILKQNDQLRTDNVAMRSQLNQTGNTLNAIADQLEKPPVSHVAKLEEQKAQAASAEPGIG